MTRALAAVAVAVAVVGNAAVAAAAPARKCPKDIAATLVPQYDGQTVDAASIVISACVWGNFAGPGWVVAHVIPWAADSKAEDGPPGGTAFVSAAGAVVAAHFGYGNEHVTVRAVDLDGDGIDEIVSTIKWSSTMSFESGERLQIARVVGDQIVELRSIDTASRVEDGPGASHCTAKTTIEPASQHRHQVVVVLSGTGSCAVGRHIYQLRKDQVIDVGPTAATSDR